MPHLSEIQKKYSGKVQVTGLNSFEHDAAKGDPQLANVEKYVKDMGDKMTYNVAVDGYERKMANAWMTASQSPGIPTSFVIGKDGTVLYIGHPMGLENVLDQVLAGTYDLVKAKSADIQRRNAAREQSARAAATRAVMQPIQEAVKAGDTDKAIGLIEAATEKNPNLALNLGYMKFNLLLKTDEAKAQAWAKTFSEGAAKDNGNLLNQLAWMIVDDKSTIKKPDFGIAIQIAERGVAATKETDPSKAFVLDTLAYAYFKNGQIDKALETQTKAVSLAEGITDFPADTLKEMKDRLDMFKKKKAGGG